MPLIELCGRPQMSDDVIDYDVQVRRVRDRDDRGGDP
jgi:hypothetical protein